MVQLASRHGYPAVSIAEISTHAGVSSATFYEQFADKEDCLLAAYEKTASRVLARLGPVDATASWEETSRTVLMGLVGALEADPDGGRLMLVEALAGGARVRATRERTLDSLRRFAQRILDSELPGGAVLDLPADMLLGAVRSIASQSLRTHSEDRMGLLVDDLMGWIESYAVATHEHGWSTGPGTRLPAQVAAGWLAAATTPPVPRRLPRGRHRLPQAAVERSQRTRIIHGTAEVMVAKGYAAATVADIVSAASISRDVFYTHFANKYEAYLAAQEYGTQSLLEACAAAYFLGESWPDRVWRALQVLVLAVAGNPELTHLRVVECYAAGTAAIEQTEQLKRAAVIFLQEGFTLSASAARLPRLAAHAITGAVFESFYGQASRGELAELPRQLPLFTYLATAPFIGPKRAIAAVERLSAQAVDAAAA
ncbi:MAG TPA: TetR/AcrR family transcriptional regulator [Solirubrobacteraceae bacterium]|nr:TetR/AcrR family transcriptional regulator [Solirubrobacteraceae bacterium]